MVGIYDCFGYGGSFDVPFEERYRLIKLAGFDCVMLCGVISLEGVQDTKRMFV